MDKSEQNNSCDKIKNATLFIFQNNNKNSEDLSQLEENDEIKISGTVPCKFRENSTVYIAQHLHDKNNYFLYGKKKNNSKMQLLAVVFLPLTFIELENAVLRIFSKFKYYNN